MWINTADANATLLDWGSNGSGEAWTMSLQDGQFSIAVGPEEIIQTESTLNNSSWQHLVAVLPNGSNLLSEVQVYVNGEFSPPLAFGSTDAESVIIKTAKSRFITIGSSLSGEAYEGTIDEVKIYNRGLSASEIAILFLDGSVRFKTSENQKPPVVELLEHLPVSSHEVIITGNVKSYDENPPTVRIFYGTEDHGFDLNAWEHNYSVNQGNTLSVGVFNATIPGLIQGETYFFRAFAESADGSDWSSGEPEVNEELIAFWRMDEVNGSLVSDSSDPFHDANLTSDSLSERPAGMSGNAIEFDGVNTLLDLDPANSRYLNEAFDARTFSAWLSLDPNLYTGPQVTRFNDLILYYPLDDESGINTTDLSIRQRLSRIEPLANWISGKFDGGLSFDQISTLLALASDYELEDLHKESFTVSLWIKPTHTSEGIFKEASIDAFQFQFPPSDYYLSSIENLLSRSPDLKSKIDGASVRISPRFIPDLVVWFDANDLNNDDQPDLPESHDLSDWADKSGNGFDATGGSHQPFLRSGTGPNGGNVVEIRRGKYMNVNGNLFIKDIFTVLKSPSSTWSYYGGPLGHQNGRGSNYLTQHNQTNFHSNQLPSGVLKTALP